MRYSSLQQKMIRKHSFSKKFSLIFEPFLGEHLDGKEVINLRVSRKSKNYFVVKTNIITHEGDYCSERILFLKKKKSI